MGARGRGPADAADRRADRRRRGGALSAPRETGAEARPAAGGRAAAPDGQGAPDRNGPPGGNGARAAARFPAGRFARGLLLGGGLPPLLMGAGAAMMFSAIRPPLSLISGATRGEIQPWFAAAGTMLSLWLCIAPPVAALTALLRLTRLRRRPALAALLAAPAAAAGMTLLLAWSTTGGPGRPEFGDELFNWGLLWLPAAAGAALCLDLGVRLVDWRARRSAPPPPPRAQEGERR